MSKPPAIATAKNGKAGSRPTPPPVSPPAAKAEGHLEREAKPARERSNTIAQPGGLPAPRRDPKRSRPPSDRRGNEQNAVSGEMLVHPADSGPSLEYDVEFDEDLTTTVARIPQEEPDDPQRVEARATIASYEQELRDEDEADRIGRFHYEIARMHEVVLGDLPRAEEHYARALTATPDHLPSIVGARRTRIAREQYAQALELFDRELRFTADRPVKAALMFAKARILEDHLNKVGEARQLYASASELAASDPVLLKAMEQADLRMSAWSAMADVYAQTANAVGADARHRAALLVRRARLHEVQSDDPDGAAELYEAALGIDASAPGALDALKRLHYERRRWRELVRVLERETELVDDSNARMMAFYRIGQIQSERLGDSKAAIAALERAVSESPDQLFVLDALARLYERAGEYATLVSTLERLAESTRDPRERLGYLHRIGDLCRDALRDDDAAMTAYESALQIDASYIPALRSLGPMYAAKKKWDALVKMHEAEASVTHDTRRRATAHARAAEILERIERWTEATRHHEHALSLDPDLASSFRALVRLYARAEEHHKLIELYDRAIERVDAERKIEYLFAIGDIYRGPLDDPEQAEAAYRRILRIRPSHLGAVHALQRVAESAGRWRALVDALELESDMVDDTTEIVELLHRAGELLHEQLGARAEAVSRFKRVLDFDPHHRSTLASLGRIYHAQGHWADLIEVYAKELEINDEDAARVSLLHKMGEVHARFLADNDKAIRCFRQALEIMPSHAPSSSSLARILRDRGDWKPLVELTKREQEHAREPSSRAIAAFRAGEIFEEHLDDKEQAEVSYGEAVKLRPDDRPAAEALARVRAQLHHFTELATELQERAQRAHSDAAAIDLLLRAGEAWADRVGALPRAIECYQGVLRRDSRNLGALLPLETLLRKTEQWDALASIYARQVEVLGDKGARAAALWERARLLELHGLGQGDDLPDCFSAILSLRPGDRGALEGLERLAARSSDLTVKAAVAGRLAEAVTEPQLRSSYLTRQAEALESSGQIKSLDIYARALSLDPQNRAAIRGLARVAEMVGHGKGMAEAAQRQAAVAKKPREAADSWVRAGAIQLEHLEDPSAAVRSFEKALLADPDHPDAPRLLGELLREHGDFEVLVERFSRAASESRDPERQSALWIEVSQVYAKELANLGAALSALQRLTVAQPDNARAQYELGVLLASDRRHDEAIVVFEKALAADPTQDLEKAAHSRLAACHEHLDDPATAFGHYGQALELAPNDHELLGRVVNLQMKTEAYVAAIDSATRLVQIARDDAERVTGLLVLARATAGAGRTEEAVDHVAAAVSIEGLDGEARKLAGELVDTRDHWRRYVDGLRRRLGSRPREPAEQASLYRELATVQYERLELRREATQTLVEGLRACGSSPDLRFDLGRRLRETGRHGEAVEQFQYLLMDEVTREEAWRELASSLDALARPREAVMARAGLVALDAANPAEREQVGTWEPRAGSVPAGSFTPQAATEIFVAREQQHAAEVLLATMSEGLAKVRTTDLSAYGIGFRDKMAPRSELPLRMVVDRVGAAFGLEEFDAYMHRDQNKGVVVENPAKPTLLLPMWLSELRPSRQVFHLARALFNVARGIHAIELFKPSELQVLLTAAARIANPNFGSHIASPDVLEDRQKLILRGVSRKRRPALQQAAENYVRTPPLDVATFVQWAQQTARRVALIFCDDLVGAVEEVARLEGVQNKRGRALVDASPVVADLLKVWVSRPAMALRFRAGLLPPMSGPNPTMTPQPVSR